MNSSRDSGCMALRPKGAEAGVAHVDGETDIDDADEEAESGKRKIVKMQSPVTPSSAEVEEHSLTHLPYRSWCKHCVRGRMKVAPHRKRDNRETENGVPEVHLDWAFPGEEEADKTITILVGRVRHTRMTMSAMAPNKSTGELIIAR